MSGGSLDYFYSSLEDHIGDFDDMELDDLVRDLAKLFYDREWYLSGDTREGAWVESRDAFKAKWFTPAGRQERITNYLDSIRDKVLKSLGMSDRYCRNCAHWEPEDAKSAYGICEHSAACLMHRGESCDKFERRQRREEQKE